MGSTKRFLGKTLACVALLGVGASLSGAARAQELAAGHEPVARGGHALSAQTARPGAPWNAIGRINRRPGGFCSGVLIAPDKVLTTAGCVWNAALRRWHAGEDLYFLAGYHLGQHIAMRRVAAIALARGIEMKRNGLPRKASDDWAVLTLRRPIPPTAAVRPIAALNARGRLRPRKLGRLVRAGFGPARPHALTRSECSAIAFVNGSTLMHDCGATFAHSGFPILVETGGGWRLLGLQMASYRRTAPKNGVGMALMAPAFSSPAQMRH